VRSPTILNSVTSGLRVLCEKEKKLHSIPLLARQFKVSYSTMKKAVGLLEKDGVIDNNGKDGIAVLFNPSRRVSIRKFLHKADLYIKVSILLNNRYSLFGNFLIKKSNSTILGFSVLSNIYFKTNEGELTEVRDNPTRLQDLIECPAKDRWVLRRKFLRQTFLSPVSRIYFKNKERILKNDLY